MVQMWIPHKGLLWSKVVNWSVVHSYFKLLIFLSISSMGKWSRPLSFFCDHVPFVYHYTPNAYHLETLNIRLLNEFLFLSSSKDIFSLAFRERGSEGETHQYKRNIDWLPLIHTLTRNGVCNLGYVPWPGIEPTTFGYRTTLQATEPHWPGYEFLF